MFRLINRLRFLYLFILLISFCFFKGINTQLQLTAHADIIFALLITSSILIIGHAERLLISLLFILAAVIILFYFLNLYCEPLTISAMRLLFIITYFIVMTYLCLYFTLQDKTISITTLFGSLSAYLLIGFIFAHIYLLIELLSPLSFSNFDIKDEARSIYFSFITLTTVGYGDINPLKPIAQTFSWFESFIGQGYLAILIGQLVGRYTATQLKQI